MAKSSIHFRPAKPNSEAHNLRKVNLDYTFPAIAHHNESWMAESVVDREKEIARTCKEISGRKLQKNAIPIREAVVNLQPCHKLEDLQELARDLKKSKGIDCFQIHIHRDEGKSINELNYHAHMLFDWQDKTTGKMLRLGKSDMSEIQDIVAESLQMERGELRENSNRKRLEATEFKRQAKAREIKKLEEQVQVLEQKKNEAVKRDRESQAKLRGLRKAHRAAVRHFLINGDPSTFPNEKVAEIASKWLARIVRNQRDEIGQIERQIEDIRMGK
jgi:hypothetical protein